MQKSLDVLLGLLSVLVGCLVVPVVPLAVLFRRPLLVNGQQRIDKTLIGDVPRSALPRWLWWFQTPDEPLPGAMYEPTVRQWRAKYGDYVCSVLWLWRNRAFGFRFWLGRPATGYIEEQPGLVEQEGLWRWSRTVWRIKLAAGWKVYRASFNAHWMHGPFRAAPFISIGLTDD